MLFQPPRVDEMVRQNVIKQCVSSMAMQSMLGEMDLRV